MASLTQWTWVCANSGRQWRTGKPGVLQSIVLQRAGHDWTMNNKLLSSDLEQSCLFNYLCCHFWTFSFLMLMSDDAAEECSWCLYWGRYFLSAGHSLLLHGVFSHWIGMTHHTFPTIGREWLKMFLGRGMSWGERNLSLCIYGTFLKNILVDYGRDGLPDELSQWSLDTAHFCLLLLFWLKVNFCLIWVWLDNFLLAVICLDHSFSILSLWALCLFLKVNCVSRQHVVGSRFLIHPVTPRLLIGEFNPFSFRMIIDRWVLGAANFVFYFLVALCLHLFLFPCASVCHFGLVVFLWCFSFLCFASLL